MATLSILGLYNADSTIFDNLVLPEGMDTETEIAAIIEKCAELEILFTNPVYMKQSIGFWCRRNLSIWNKLYATTQLEYNPISNYDRTEEWEDAGESSGESVGKTAGYNSYELVDSNGADSKVNNSSTHKGRMYGNIGVTTTQQMIKEEREVNKFDMYDYIAEQFKTNYCLMVY